jgi:DHA1 family bicyclomycin/chloramphenicol resistance-like MFS transporter
MPPIRLATVGMDGSAAALLRAIQMLAGAGAGALIGVVAGNQLRDGRRDAALCPMGLLFLGLRQRLKMAQPDIEYSSAR